MKRCWIIGAGSVAQGDLPFAYGAEDLIVAADGGYCHLKQAGMEPHLLVGDFDSMDRPQVGCEVVTLPVEKDDTDLLAAVKEGFARGYTHFVLLGCLGGDRLSHTLANVQLLSFIKERGGDGLLVLGGTRVRMLKEETTTYPATQQGSCSVFAYSEQATLSLDGLYYPLNQGEITSAFPLGVSNHFIGKEATVTVHQGTIVVVIEE